MRRLILSRNYTLSNENDEFHISNGRCPNYALLWNRTENELYWPNGHDYFMGNGSDINDGTRDLREILSDRMAKGIFREKLLFCDLDGVLVDFEKGIENTFGENICDIIPSKLLDDINNSSKFFENLPWMPKGRELWERIKEYHPIILTVVLPCSSSATEQKIRWCQRELGPDIKVISCSIKDKLRYCSENTFLIDDRLETVEDWKYKGGECILYDEKNLDTNLQRIDRYMNNEVSYSP
jgi:hypothetical protein